MKHIKTIPTFLALAIVGLGVLTGVLLINQAQTFSPKATGQTQPEQVRITNINDNSFVVSWITQSATKGFVIFGENSQLEKTAFDGRDNSVATQQSLTHYVLVKNLKPATRYLFKINSGGTNYNDGDKPYEITTAPTINSPLPENDTAYGMILNQEGNPAKGAIVYLSLANTTAQSSLVQEDGSWMIPLSMARSISLTSYSNYDKQLQIEENFVQDGSLGTISAINTTKNDSPAPTMTLGKTYDFTQVTNQNLSPTPGNSLFSAAPTATGSSTSPTPTTGHLGSGFSPDQLTSSSSGRLNILNPSDGEGINTAKPEFQGTAPANQVIEIVVESETAYSGQTLVDQQGNWQWSPPADLSPGLHTVTATLKGLNGIEQKVVRSFTVLAAGETDLPAITATGSGQTVTVTPEPTRIITTPTPEPTLAPSGNLTPTVLYSTIGLILLVLGLYQLIWANQ